MKAPPFGGVFLWVIFTLVRITRVNSKLGNKTASNSETLCKDLGDFFTNGSSYVKILLFTENINIW